MPLLDGIPYEVEELQNIKDDEQLWVVPDSGEACRSYEDFRDLLRAYRKRSWSCKYTGRAGLTYLEALGEEKKNAHQVQKFPPELEEKCAPIVHHSAQDLAQLASRIQSTLSPDGKENQAKASKVSLNGPTVRSWILRAAKFHEELGVWSLVNAQRFSLPDLTPELEEKFKKEKLAREQAAAKALVEAKDQKEREAREAREKEAQERKARREAEKAKKDKEREEEKEKKKKEREEEKERKKAEKAAEKAKDKEEKKEKKKEDKDKKEKEPKTPGAGDEGGEGEGAKVKKPKERTGMLRTLEEEKERLKEGTHKHVAFTVMYAKNGPPEGMGFDEIIQAAISSKLRAEGEWDDAKKRGLRHVLTNDITFCVVARVPRIKWALRAAPQVVALPDEAPSSPGPVVNGLGDSTAISTGEAGPSNAGDQPEKDKAAKAQDTAARLKAAEEKYKKSVADLEKQLVDARAKLAAKEKEVAAAEVASPKSTGKRKAATQQPEDDKDAEGEAAGASPAAGPTSPATTSALEALLPPELKTYTGVETDRKAKVEWRKRREEGIKKLRQEQEEQRKAKAKAEAQEKQSKRQKALEAEVQAVRLLQQKLDAAKENLAKTQALRSKAEKDADKSKQISELKALKEKAKAEREAERERAKQALIEERERRKQEALNAKKYPIDDQELLKEEKEKAQEAGQPAPPEDVALPGGDAFGGETPWVAVLGERAASLAGRLMWQDVCSLMFVADLVAGFSKPLGIKVTQQVSAEQLAALLAVVVREEGEADAGALGTESESHQIAQLYRLLLTALLKDMNQEEVGGRSEERWQTALEGCPPSWPEVLRRLALRKAADARDNGPTRPTAAAAGSSGDLPGPLDAAVAGAINTLGVSEVSRVSASQHAALLRFLSDELLDTDLLREALSKRTEDAQEKAAEIRSELATVRAELREILDKERDARKRDREKKLAAQQAKLAAAEAAAGTSAAGAEGGGEKTEGSGKEVKGPVSKKAKKEAPASKKEEEEGQEDGKEEEEEDGDEEEEEDVAPSFELPFELEMYRGNVGDKKAMMKFRQDQQAEKKKLEKARAEWEAGARARAKAREAALRAKQEEARRQEKRKATLEEQIATLQEQLEKETDRCTVRRAPLGQDRNFRTYWWGMAGCRGAVLVESADGSQLEAVLSDMGSLESLINSLNNKGIRERELKASLTKALPTLTANLKKAATATDAAADKEGAKDEGGEKGGSKGGGHRAKKTDFFIPPDRVLPSRSTRFHGTMDDGTKLQVVEAPKGKKGGLSREGSANPQHHDIDPFLASGTARDAFEAQALAGAVASLNTVAAAALAAKVPAPAGGWKVFQARLERLLKGDVEPAWAQDLSEQDEEAQAAEAAGRPLRGGALVVAHLRLRAQELEHLVASATGEYAYLQKLAAQEVDVEGSSEEEEEGQQEQEGKEDGMEVDGQEDGEEDGKVVKRRRVRHAHGTHQAGATLVDDSEEVVLEADEVPAGSVPLSKRPAFVWHSVAERNSWVAAVQKARTSARVAYCAAVLEALGAGPLAALRKASGSGAAADKAGARVSGGREGRGSGGGAKEEGKAGVKKEEGKEPAPTKGGSGRASGRAGDKAEPAAGRGGAAVAAKGSRGKASKLVKEEEESEEEPPSSVEEVEEEDLEEEEEATSMDTSEDESEEKRERAQPARGGRNTRAKDVRKLEANGKASGSRRGSGKEGDKASGKLAAKGGVAKPQHKGGASAGGRATRSQR